MRIVDDALYGDVKPRKRHQHHEDALHTQIARALEMLLDREKVEWWSNENRFNGAREGARRKARGCRAGVPDMEFHHDGRSLFIELKHGDNRPTKAQRDIHASLRRQKMSVAVCRSLDDVVSVLRDVGFPMRGELA
ncbi:hypothetical protein [Acetobacter sp.]|uniref:hypothetical protein n=1 Tax=Acetobacter sp. TaxID=440 RepID=UPI0039EAEA5C